MILPFSFVWCVAGEKYMTQWKAEKYKRAHFSSPMHLYSLAKYYTLRIQNGKGQSGSLSQMPCAREGDDAKRRQEEGRLDGKGKNSFAKEGF